MLAKKLSTLLLAISAGVATVAGIALAAPTAAPLVSVSAPAPTVAANDTGWQ